MKLNFLMKYLLNIIFVIVYCITFRMSFNREIEVGDSTIVISQQLDSDVNGVVWDSALVAIHYLSKRSDLINGKKIMELGSGTGVVSIGCASIGECNVIATDLPDRIDIIMKNIKLNEGVMKGEVKSDSLDWNIPYDKNIDIDLLLVIDCVYYRDSVNALLDTIKGINATKTLIGYEKRDIGEPVEAQKQFMDIINNEFNIEMVSNEDLDEYACDDIQLFFISVK